MKLDIKSIKEITTYEGTKDGRYIVVQTEIESHDQEKNTSYVHYVIEDTTTNKFYATTLLSSQWHGQDKYNADQDWDEVKRFEKVTYYYR